MTTARATARTSPRRDPAPRPPRPSLRVVPPPRQRAPRAPFVLLSFVVVGLGLLALLGLNTAVAEGAFSVHELRTRAAALAEDEQRLRREVAALEAPANLAARAGALGLVPASDPVFLRTTDGAVLGVPIPASAAPKPATAAPRPQPSAAASAKPTAAPRPGASAAPKPGASAKPGPSATPRPGASAAPKASPKPSAKPSPSGTP